MNAAARDHRTSNLYGALAYAVVVVSCYAGYFFHNSRFFNPESMVPVTFALGAAYAVLGVLGSTVLDCRHQKTCAWYFLAHLALLTALVLLSPIRGYFGIIVLPVISQAIFDLRPRWAVLVSVYLFSLNVALWWIPFGWASGLQAVVNYSAGFAFTILFSIITKRAVDAREREEQLRHEIEAAHAKLQAYAAQAEDLATTRERNRVAREIHDGVGHYLTVVKTQLDAAAALLGPRPDEARESIRKAAQLASDALDDVRRSVSTLRTDTTRPPLPETLRSLVAETGLPAAVRVTGELRPLPPGIEHALFRSAQEALTNVRKHAGATRTTIDLDFGATGRVTLAVMDDGRGAHEPAAPGFGLTGIRERVEVLGGRVEAGNRPGGGFALTVEVPA